MYILLKMDIFPSSHVRLQKGTSVNLVPEISRLYSIVWIIFVKLEYTWYSDDLTQNVKISGKHLQSTVNLETFETFGDLTSLIVLFKLLILLMEEILHHLGCKKPCK